jgi:hypothetical protein
MTKTIERSLQELDFASLKRRTFIPSPAAWEDQVLYFLLLDRFSDGNEKDGYRDDADRPVQDGSTPLYRPEDSGRVDYDVWFRAGGGWQGGTLKGLKSKLGYLRRLGITALWVSPVFRQVAFEPSYHGYGIQNFLDVDPHFGTREEFRDFVQAAHEQGIYVILDIIAHHTGNVFSYNADRYTTHDPASGRWYNDPRWDGKPYAVQGFNDRDGQPTLPFNGQPDANSLEAAWPDGAIWPREFQRPELFLRKGHIVNWDYNPEYAEGDLFALKTLDIWVRRDGQYRQASSALGCLALAYCFWIAYADLDGFRIDAAKHMGEEALRTFCDVIREFAQSIGKERFLLVGEVAGNREQAWEVVEKIGLDAALGIEDVPGKLERMVTGFADPADYFSLFRNWVLDAGRAPLVSQPGGDPGGRPRPGPQGRWQVAVLRRRALPRPSLQRDGRPANDHGHPLHLLRLGAGFRQRRAPQRLRPRAPREHVRRPVWRPLLAGASLLQRGRRPVPGPGRAHGPAQEAAAAAAGPASAASPLRGRNHLRPAAPPRRPDPLAGVLVAPVRRSGSPGRGEHRRVAARHRLVHGRAHVSGRGGSVSSDLLVRPEACFAAFALVDRGAPERAAGGPDDPPGRRVRHLSGGPRLEPPGPQPAPGLETVATACGSRLTADHGVMPGVVRPV